jgi:hypothetical protein
VRTWLFAVSEKYLHTSSIDDAGAPVVNAGAGVPVQAEPRATAIRQDMPEVFRGPSQLGEWAGPRPPLSSLEECGRGNPRERYRVVFGDRGAALLPAIQRGTGDFPGTGLCRCAVGDLRGSSAYSEDGTKFIGYDWGQVGGIGVR